MAIGRYLMLGYLDPSGMVIPTAQVLVLDEILSILRVNPDDMDP